MGGGWEQGGKPAAEARILLGNSQMPKKIATFPKGSREEDGSRMGSLLKSYSHPTPILLPSNSHPTPATVLENP